MSDKNMIFKRDDERNIIEFNPEGIMNRLSLSVDGDFYEILNVTPTRLKVKKIPNGTTHFTVYDLIFEYDDVVFKELDTNIIETVEFNETYN